MANAHGGREDEEDEKITLHLCQCKERYKAHVHCSCELCEGKAVPTTTAWRHRKNIILTRSSTLNRTEISSQGCPDVDSVLNSNSPDSSFHTNGARNNANTEEPPSSTLGDSEEIDVAFNDDDHMGADDMDMDDCMFSEGSESDDDYNSDDSSNSDDDDGSYNGNNIRNPRDTQTTNTNDFEKFIEDAILRLVEMKAQHGFSIKAFEQLLSWGKELHCHGNEKISDRWPQKWEDVTKLLQSLGYKEAKCYWICLDSSHPCSYSLMCSQDENCTYCGKHGSIPFYYLSLLDKVKRWCASPSMCKNMTAHWQEKDHWLNYENSTGWGQNHKNEIWDGTRFSELAYFWNPDDEWILPVYCPNPDCHIVVSASELMDSPQVFGIQNVTCPGCFNQFQTEIKTTNGDPRNLAYIAHWDGWQPFSSSARGCGAIEVTIATMSKEKRCSTEEVYVVGFVPSYLLPNKTSISLDPFIEPLIRDIESGFINGIKVDYSVSICGKEAGNAVIRHLILCWSGDHVGQCEVGKIIKCGKCPCRRCKLKGEYFPDTNHYYYPGFRKSTRYPTEAKTLTTVLNTLREIEEEERISIKKQKAKESGYTGLSILHRLNKLYAFEYDKDLVYDELHAFSLNVVKNQLLLFKEDEDAINWKEVDKRLNRFPWTREFNASRKPRGIMKRIGYWKAEEYYKFAFPASEIVFHGLLSEEQSEIWMCLTRMAEFLQNHARNGWLEEDANTFHNMSLRYAVLVEEKYGPTSCHTYLHNLLHLKEDIQRFSGLDNYSCWVQERAVQRYISQSNNCKNIEATFAATEIRREVVKIQKELGNSHPSPDKVDANKLWARSLEQAKLLYKSVDPALQKAILGITVGGMKNTLLKDNDCSKTAEACSVDINDVSRTAFTCRSVWKPLHGYGGLLYREKEFAVVISCVDGEGEVIGKIQKIYTVAVDENDKTFLTLQVYSHVDFIEGGIQLVTVSHRYATVPVANLSRKLMMYPSENIGLEPHNFIVVDFMRRIFPVSADLVVVPYYPVVNDMVEVQGDGEVWKAKVVAFSLVNQNIRGAFFIHTQNGIWVPEQSRVQDIHFTSILGLSNGLWVRNYTCWQDIPL